MNPLTVKEQKAMEGWGTLGFQLKAERKSLEEIQRNEKKKARLERILKVENYAEFCMAYFSEYMTHPLAKGHIEAAKAVLGDPEIRFVWEAYRGFAKSVHGGMIIPIWLMLKGELKYMVLCSDTQPKAAKLIGRIKDEILGNAELREDFGIRPVYGSFTKDGFGVMLGNGQQCYFNPIGINDSPRGLVDGPRRPDMIVCDDTDTEKRCKNTFLVGEAVNWITKALMYCFGEENKRFLFLNSRVDEFSILTQIIEKFKTHSNFYYLNVPALDENDMSTWEERFPTEKLRKERANDFTGFMSERQNKPMKEGGKFKRKWIKWELPLDDWMEYDALVMYCDPSFSTSTYSDHSAIKLWGFKGFNKTCLKAYNRNWETLDEALEWWYDWLQTLSAPVRDMIQKWIEANGTQRQLIDAASDRLREKKGKYLRIKHDTKKKGPKAERIGDMETDYRDGLVSYSELEKDDADMHRSIQHLCTWNEDKNKEDDSPDADHSAWVEGEKLAKRKRNNGKYFQIGGYSFNISRG